MSSQRVLTQRWLAKESTRYESQKDRVYADVDAALAAYSTLRIKTDVYTYDDGRVKTLLCAYGLLPISFRGKGYNIPIACWITLEYPREPPLAYVVPTGDMHVRPGNGVDVSGLCQFEYQKQWITKPDACSLRGLLEIMQQEFSRVPPVYARPRTPPSSQPIIPSSRPPPPIPIDGSSAIMGSPSPASNRPPLPTNIASPPDINSPSPQPGPSGHFRQSSTTDYSMRPPPPLPSSDSRPPHYASPQHTPTRAASPQPPASMNLFRPSREPPPPPTYNLPPRPPPPQITPYPPQRYPQQFSPQQSQLYSAHSIPNTSYAVSTPPPAVFPVPPPASHYTPSPPIPQPPSVSPHAIAIKPRTPAPDLLEDDNLTTLSSQSVAEDLSLSTGALPPRPPNPQLIALQSEVHGRLNAGFQHIVKELAEDTARLRATQEDLLAGEPAIRDEMARLMAVRDVCRTVGARTKEWVENVESRLAEARRRGEPEVDELVCSTTIVYNQLIDLVAEDNAIEDTIYHLHRGLNAGRIDLDRFIKTTRELAEEQFMKRALIEKIEQGMPLRDRWS